MADETNVNLELDRAWKTARKEKPNDFSVKLPEGEFTAKLTAARQTKTKGKNIDVVYLDIVVTGPSSLPDGFEPAGMTEQLSYFLQNRTFANGNKVTIADISKRVSLDLQNMGIDVEQTNTMQEAVALASKQKPNFKIKVATGKNSGKKYIMVTEPIKDGETIVNQSDGPEAPVTNDEVITDDDNAWEPRRGERYYYPITDGLPSEITGVSRSKRTVKLIDDEGTTHEDVSWDDIGDEYYVDSDD